MAHPQGPIFRLACCVLLALGWLPVLGAGCTTAAGQLSVADGPPPSAHPSASRSPASASSSADSAQPPRDAGLSSIADGAPLLAATPPASSAARSYPFNEPLARVRASKGSRASHYANLSPRQCRVELRKRKLPFKRVGGASPGIATPLRITGPLHGVRFIVPNKRTPYGKLDCRLALVLDDFSAFLADHQVTAVHVDNFYRPHARLPSRRKPSQHAYGLAADLFAFTLSSGKTLVVERDFHGEIGTPVCGPQARVGEDWEDGVTLRNLVCALARERLFNHMLTPNYNTAHHNHFHLDIARDDKRLVIE